MCCILCTSGLRFKYYILVLTYAFSIQMMHCWYFIITVLQCGLCLYDKLKHVSVSFIHNFQRFFFPYSICEIYNDLGPQGVPSLFFREVQTTWDTSVKLVFWLFHLVLPALYFIISCNIIRFILWGSYEIHKVSLTALFLLTMLYITFYPCFFLSFPTSITNDNAGVLPVRWACSLAVWQLPGRFGGVGLGDPPHRFALDCMQAVATLSSHSNDY